MNTPDQVSWKATSPTWVSRRSVLTSLVVSIIALPWCNDTDSFPPGQVVQISGSVNPSDIHVLDPTQNIKIIKDAELDKALQLLYGSLAWSHRGKKAMNLDGTWNVTLYQKGQNDEQSAMYKIYQDSSKNAIIAWWKNSRHGIGFEYNETNGTIENRWLDTMKKSELMKFVWEILSLL